MSLEFHFAIHRISERKPTTETSTSNIGRLKDTLKAFDDFQKKQKSVRSNVF